MGPKKGGKGGGGLHELDHSVFSREGVDFSNIEGEVEELDVLLSGKLAVVSKLFPEWNIEGENWGAEIPSEELHTTTYPSYISTNGDPVAIKVHLGLEEEAPADPKAKGKKDAKKGAPASDELTEPEKDEDGKPLPRMFIPTDNTKNKYEWNFRRKWEPRQAALNTEFEVIKAEVSEASQKASEAPEDEEARAALEAAQAKETAFMDENKDTIAAPSGEYFDPCFIGALNLVFRFGPAVVKAKGGSFEPLESGAVFPESVRCLWENIYPKLPDGRPMYNPAGKYAVRLFLGGAWRMIKVNDAIPCSENNVPALQGSAEPLELWPTILSKALYAAFTACGYMDTMKDILSTSGSEGSDGVKVEDAVKARRTATYVCFVVHLLTGWLPCTPWSISGLLTKNGQMLRTLLDRIVSGGAPQVNREDIPSGPILVQDEDESRSASKATDADGRKVLKTKKQFKELYAKAKAEKERMLSIIGSREQQVSYLDDVIDSISKEPFSLCYLDAEGNPCVVPVLAVSFPEQGSSDLGNTQLLVDWSKLPGVVVRVEGANIAEQTPVEMTWITLNALMAKNAFLFSFDSLTIHVNTATLSAEWEAAEEPDAGKGKKGKGAEPVADPQLTERGQLSPMLLSLAKKKKTPVPTTESGEAIEGSSDEGTDVIQDAEQPSGPITLSISIQADLPKIEALALEEGSEEAPPAPVKPCLQDGVVLILTEVRFDDKPPLVLRTELDKESELPLTRVSLQIPKEELYGSADMPALFLVSLYSRASLQVYFSSDVEVSVGPVEEIWTGLGMSARVHEGEAKPTPAKTEQQFCEISMSIPVPPPTEGQEEEKKEHIMNVPAISLFHVRSVAVGSNISLVHAFSHYDHKAAVDDSLILPRIGPNLLRLSEVGSVSRLIGRSYPLSTDKHLPAFKWKAILLCEEPMETESRDLSGNECKRYSGLYAPNKELIVFEDVLNVDKASFPLSFRLNLSPLEPPAPTEGEDVENGKEMDEMEKALKGTTVSVSMYRKSDNKRVHQYIGRRLVSAYSIPIIGFLEDGEEPPVAAPPDPKGKGKGKETGTGCEIVMKCTIEATLCAVPDDWRSSLPYMHYGADGIPKTGTPAEPAGEEKESGPLHDVPSVKPKFGWSLDVLAANALSMTHDFRRLEKAVEEKNSWGASDDTRAERAAAATAYLTNKLKAQALLSGGADVKAEVFDHLSQAIQMELPHGKVLEGIVMDSSRYTESIYGPALSSRPFTSGEELESPSVASLDSLEVSTSSVPKLVTDPYKDRGHRNREQKRVDQENAAAFESYLKFKDIKWQQKTDRVEALLQQAQGVDSLFKWDDREKYRKFVLERNQSLQTLLGRATQAKSDAKDIEDGKDPNKGKKKK